MAISFDSFPLGMSALKRDLHLVDEDAGKKSGAVGTLRTGSAVAGDAAQGADSAGGVVVEISDEARRRAAGEPDTTFTAAPAKADGGEGEDKTTLEQLIDRLKERIEKLKQEIRELEQKSMPDEAKQKMLEMKRNELMQLQQQLAEAQMKQGEGAEGSSGSSFDGRGTSAQGATTMVRPD
jgi:DnaJ-domain-containing protein 1